MALTKAPEELLDKSLTSALTITTADNTTQLTLTSTDADENVGPRLDLKRDSSTPAADDYLGVIRWLGEDDAGNALSYAHMSTYLQDPTDGAEDGKFEIDTRVAGTMRSRLLIHSTSTVFNQEAQNVNFRVESSGNGNMLFVDGADNRVGIGTGDPDSLVHLSGSGGASVLRFENTDTGLSIDEVIGKLEFETKDTGGAGVNAYILAAGNNTSGAAYIGFGTGTGGSTTEAARFDSSQRLMIGTTEAITTNTTGKLQMAGTSSAASTFNISRFSNDASSATLSFAKSRNASIGGNTVVSSGDNLGSITFHGDDGTDTVTMAAKILGEVDGTPGSNDMPGRLAFFTTPDGNTSPSERLRINSTGDILHGITAVPTGVQLGTQLVSASTTGADIIAFRKDTAVAVDDLVGAFLVGNSDTSGTEDHFAGMWGRVTSVNGSMELRFAGGREGYENNTPTFTIGSNGDIGAPSGDNIYDASDERLKENVVALTDGLSKVCQLKPVSYNYKSGWNEDTEGKTKYGFGAQTTASVDELLVEPFSNGDAELNGETIENPLRVNEKFIIPLLVKAIQEQQALIETLEAKVKALEEA